jgi:hypothetical protein
MPHFWTDIKTGKEILVVTYDELIPEFYSSVGYLSRKVSEDKKRGYGLRNVRYGGGTESVALLEFDSLPARIREEMEDPRRGRHPLEAFYELDMDAVNFFKSHKLEGSRYIPEENQDEYIANASVINAIIKLKKERENAIICIGKRPKKIWESLCDDAKSFNEILRKKYKIEHRLPGNYRRFQETAEEYQRDGYISLIKGYHTSKNALLVDDKTWSLLESIFTSFDHKPNYMDVWACYSGFLKGSKTIVHNETAEIFNPADFNPLSLATIRSYLNRWESKNATLRLRTGDRQKLMAKTKPHHSMDIPKYAGSIISVDDRQPPFEYAKSQRVWFYLAYDVGAQCYTTWVYGKTKEGLIVEFYRQMARNYAEWGLPLPAELECESSLNSSFRDTLLKEGNMFRYVRIESNNARGKYIERKNKDARYGAEKEMDGWIARPFAKSEANQQGTNEVPIIPYDEIVCNVLTNYENYNNEKHPIYTDKTRWEVFCENQNPDLTPTNWHGILPYIGYETKTSCNVGIVRLNGGEFLLGESGSICTGDNLISIMKIVEGEDLVVRWLDDNDGGILKAFAYIGSEFVCELLPKPRYNRARIEQTEADCVARELMSKYVMTIESYGNARKKAIEKVTIINEPVDVPVLKNRFLIRELHQKPLPNYLNSETVEILEDNLVIDDGFNINERTFKRSLKETY